MPSGGKLLSAALVRRVIQCCALQFFAGRVTGPLKVAPACRRMTSPHAAFSSALLTSPPARTSVFLPLDAVLESAV